MRKVIKLFENHSVSVSGVKGSGKDLLMANVVARRNQYYISNMNYKSCTSGAKWIDLDFSRLRSGNTYREFLSQKVKKYVYPYPDGTDIYISDCGIFFPCQYNDRLNREYEDLPTFLALSRQLGDCRVHTNAQFLGRVWDKIREQSDCYIVCQWAKVLPIFNGLVVQSIRIYEKYDSAEKNVPPFRMTVPLFANSVTRNAVRMEQEKYTIQYGKIREKLLVYPNLSKYDTRQFKTILEGGKNE